MNKYMLVYRVETKKAFTTRKLLFDSLDSMNEIWQEVVKCAKDVYGECICTPLNVHEVKQTHYNPDRYSSVKVVLQ